MEIVRGHAVERLPLVTRTHLGVGHVGGEEAAAEEEEDEGDDGGDMYTQISRKHTAAAYRSTGRALVTLMILLSASRVETMAVQTSGAPTRWETNRPDA